MYVYLYVCLYVCYRRLNRSSDRDETLGDVREHAWEGFRVIKTLRKNKGGPGGVNIDFLYVLHTALQDTDFHNLLKTGER